MLGLNSSHDHQEQRVMATSRSAIVPQELSRTWLAGYPAHSRHESRAMGVEYSIAGQDIDHENRISAKLQDLCLLSSAPPFL